MLAPIRSLLGLGQADVVSSAAAPLPPEVSAFFAGLGMRILDIYGMTETTGAFTSNTVTEFRMGSVGRAFAGTEIVIADDGEILTRGPLNTPGYLNRPDLTAELIDAEGWLHTGDIGGLDEDGFLSVVDRKKELIITAGGENVPPAVIENMLVAHPLIGQALAYGDRRPYVVALLTLDARGRPGLGPGAGHRGRLAGRAGPEPRGAGRDRGGRGHGQPAAGPGAAGQAVAAAAGGMDRGERGTDADAEAQAARGAREVLRRHRHPLRRLGPPPDKVTTGGVWVPGGPPGLQNRWTALRVAGGFDSRPPPPLRNRGRVSPLIMR